MKKLLFGFSILLVLSGCGNLSLTIEKEEQNTSQISSGDQNLGYIEINGLKVEKKSGMTKDNIITWHDENLKIYDDYSSILDDLPDVKFEPEKYDPVCIEYKNVCYSCENPIENRIVNRNLYEKEIEKYGTGDRQILYEGECKEDQKIKKEFTQPISYKGVTFYVPDYWKILSSEEKKSYNEILGTGSSIEYALDVGYTKCAKIRLGLNLGLDNSDWKYIYYRSLYHNIFMTDYPYFVGKNHRIYPFAGAPDSSLWLIGKDFSISLSISSGSPSEPESCREGRDEKNYLNMKDVLNISLRDIEIE